MRLYAKLEGFNPGGSVKDRAALWMVRDGLATGALHPGKTIIDSTSGNTGIALAMIGAALGYPVTLVMPDNVSRERKRIISAFGAEVVFSSGLEGSDGAILLCRELLAEEPERYFKPDQYFNPMNPQAHYESTGPEIWDGDRAARVTHFVAGIGTGGTVMGTGRYLKERNPRASRSIAAEPDDALHGLEGLKHMATLDRAAASTTRSELDRKIPVPTDAAYDLVYELGARYGLVVGQSSGAALYAARTRRARARRRRRRDDLPRLRRPLPEHQSVGGMERMAANATETRLSAKRAGAPRSTRARIYLTYPPHLIKEPLIYELGKQFALRTNIRGANVSETMGLVALEVEGTRAEIDRGIAWLRERGVTVEPIEKNVIE